MKIDEQLLEKVVALIKKDIENRRTSAAMSGEWGDNGAGQIQNQLEVFTSAIRGHFPSCWKSYVLQAEKEADPEYEEYLKLKKKFGGK